MGYSRQGNMINSSYLQTLHTEPDSKTEDQQRYRQFFEAYQRRELVLSLLSQLNHLVIDIQRHRGISMGLLAGNRAFENDFTRLQFQIDRRLATFSAFASSNENLLSSHDKENIQLAWSTIRQDWQDDKLSDNFELHSHFIEQLFQLTQKLSKMLETPTNDEFGNKFAMSSGAPEPRTNQYQRSIKQMEIVNFICALLPHMIENLAKIRGLATFSAAMGIAQYDHDRKLRFYLQCAREQNEKLRQCAQRLHEVLGGELNAKYVIGESETKFVHLIELVTHDVLSGKTIHSSSSQLFNLATYLIDKYWSVVDDGLDILRVWHRRDLEDWVIEPGN